MKSGLQEVKEVWIVDLSENNPDVWSIDIECNSREEAINEGMKLAKENELKIFHIGREVSCGHGTIDGDNIIECLQEQMYEAVGEVSDVYLEEVTQEQSIELEEKLNEVIYEWHKKHNLFPSCFLIEDEEVIQVK